MVASNSVKTKKQGVYSSPAANAGSRQAAYYPVDKPPADGIGIGDE
jgi:hypothetical protein